MTRDTRGFVAGVDLGTRYAVIGRIVPGPVLPAFAIFTKVEVAETTPAANRELACRISIEFRRYELTTVRIERPMGRQIRTVSDIARLGGAIAARVPLGAGVDELDAQAWKTLLGIGGNASKDAYIDFARRHLQLDADVPLTEHEAAAYCLAASILVDSYPELGTALREAELARRKAAA